MPRRIVECLSLIPSYTAATTNTGTVRPVPNAKSPTGGTGRAVTWTGCLCLSHGCLLSTYLLDTFGPPREGKVLVFEEALMSSSGTRRGGVLGECKTAIANGAESGFHKLRFPLCVVSRVLVFWSLNGTYCTKQHIKDNHLRISAGRLAFLYRPMAGSGLPGLL